MTVEAVERIGAAEYDLWYWYYLRNGFTSDRIEWAVALGCSHIARCWGSTVEAGVLIPRFKQPGLLEDKEAKIAGLSSVTGAQVTKGGRYGK